MLLSDWRLLLRRWYVVVVGVLATAGLGVVAARLVPISYVATAHMVLLPPRASEGTGVNPYLGLGGLENMANVVTLAMADDTTTKALLAQGISDKYAIALDRAAGGPILLVTAEEPNRAKALRSLDILIQWVPRTTQRLQTDSSIPRRALIEAALIGKAGEPEVNRKSQIRALIVAVAGGLSLTLFGTALLDSWLRRRTRVRNPRASGSISSDTSDPQPEIAQQPEDQRVTELTSRWHQMVDAPGARPEDMDGDDTSEPRRESGTRIGAGVGGGTRLATAHSPDEIAPADVQEEEVEDVANPVRDAPTQALSGIWNRLPPSRRQS